MYSVVMMMALTGPVDLPDFGHRRRGGCCGCSGGGYSSCYGGCYGGGYGGCYGGCYGGGYGGCYGGCYGGGYGGCYGGVVDGCGCYGGTVVTGTTNGTSTNGTSTNGTKPPTRTAAEKAQLKEMLDAYKDEPAQQKEIQAYFDNPTTTAEDWAGFYKKFKEMKEARNAGRATIVVTLPADAKLTIDGEKTRSTASRRMFVSPVLAKGKVFHYTFRAEFVRDSKPVLITKQVTVEAGKESRVSITAAAAPAVARR